MKITVPTFLLCTYSITSNKKHEEPRRTNGPERFGGVGDKTERNDDGLCPWEYLNVFLAIGESAQNVCLEIGVSGLRMSTTHRPVPVLCDPYILVASHYIEPSPAAFAGILSKSFSIPYGRWWGKRASGESTRTTGRVLPYSATVIGTVQDPSPMSKVV